MKRIASYLLTLALLVSCLSLFAACGKENGDLTQESDKTATEAASPSKKEENADPSADADKPSDGADDKEKDPNGKSDADTWDGTADTEWYQKSKQSFSIGTAEQLAGLAQIVNKLDSTKTNATPPTINVTLTADIDLSGFEWTPIGDREVCKALGTFDGAGHTVSGFRITDSTANYGYMGLFGYCYFDVKNLQVREFTIHTATEQKTHVGGLMGHTIAKITDCHAQGTISVVSARDIYVGGLVGKNLGGSIDASSAAGSVMAESTYAEEASSHCYAYVGGLVGFNQGTVANCYAVSSVGGSAAFYGTDVGGFVGRTIMPVTNCYAAGNVIASCMGNETVSAGGFAGRINTTVEGCYATGNVTVAAKGDYAVGGFGGSVSGTLTECYRASEQIFWVMQVGATYHTATNEDGVGTPFADMNTADFHKTTLGWDEAVWNLADGEKPTLK